MYYQILTANITLNDLESSLRIGTLSFLEDFIYSLTSFLSTNSSRELITQEIVAASSELKGAQPRYFESFWPCAKLLLN